MQPILFALVAVVSLSTARALTLNTPASAFATQPLEVTWEHLPDDPTFSLELVNFKLDDSFGLATDVDPGLGSIEVTLPLVPTGDDA